MQARLAAVLEKSRMDLEKWAVQDRAMFAFLRMMEKNKKKASSANAKDAPSEEQLFGFFAAKTHHCILHSKLGIDNIGRDQTEHISLHLGSNWKADVCNPANGLSARRMQNPI